jgi:hypothetical protein
MKETGGCLAILLVILIAVGISVLMTGAFVALACWAFGWTFSWKVTIGVFAIICLLNMIFGGSKS